MKISGLVMVKNEASFFLKESLQSFLELCDEIIVMMDGPKWIDDWTVLKQFDKRVKVFHETEIKNVDNKAYGDIKNKGIEKCTGDWIYSFDADEILHEKAVPEIKRILGDCKEKGVDCLDIEGQHYYWFLNTADAEHKEHFWQGRLFKNNGKIKYPEGKAHGLVEGFERLGVIRGNVVHHYGYCKNLVFDLERYEMNMRLLEIHDESFLKEWFGRRALGKMMVKEVPLGWHPKIIQDKFRIWEWAVKAE